MALNDSAQPSLSDELANQLREFRAARSDTRPRARSDAGPSASPYDRDTYHERVAAWGKPASIEPAGSDRVADAEASNAEQPTRNEAIRAPRKGHTCDEGTEGTDLVDHSVGVVDGGSDGKAHMDGCLAGDPPNAGDALMAKIEGFNVWMGRSMPRHWRAVTCLVALAIAIY